MTILNILSISLDNAKN